MPPNIYQDIAPESGLQQGDILDKSPAILSALGKVFPEDLISKTNAFIVLTQTCDLMRRNKKPCKAKYINLATVSPLEDSIIMLLDDICDRASLNAGSTISGIYISKDKYKAEQLIERILNQTEEDRALFYLPPQADAGIGVHSIVNLQVNAPLKVDCYDSLVGNLKGRLKNEYQNRLGWLVGNLFSRVAIPEFDINEKKSIIKDFLTPKDKESGPFWISRDAITEAQSKKIEMNENEKTIRELYELLEAQKPSSSKEKAMKRIISIIKEEEGTLSESKLQRISDRLNQDAVFGNYIRRPE